MPIQIIEGADPLSDAALKSESEAIVRNAQTDAGRVLKLELLRYCRGEVHGRSFLVAGHRGAGKTMMVADALDKVLRQSRRPGESLLRPLPIFLHGPSLFELEAAAPPRPDDTRRRPRREPPPAAGADSETQRVAALKQIILGVHRAVVKEFVRAYRQRLVDGPVLRQPAPWMREDVAGLAAQFEIEITEDPAAARLHEFWEMAGALQLGVLFDFSPRLDQGARELVALNGMCNAHQRISGEISAQDKSARSEEASSESQSGLDLRGGELIKPLVSVLAGAAVAGGAAAGSHGLGLAMVGGLATAIGSAVFFKASTTTTRRAERHLDTTFIPDLSLKTLDRILPTLIQRLRDCGLAPVLIVDELDKVADLADRFVPMMDFMKKLVAENVFSCFVTDRSYLETLRMRSQGTAHGRASSYFTHSLLVTYRPVDVEAYLDKLLEVDRTPSAPLPGLAAPPGTAPDMGFAASPPDAEVDVVDLEVLKWVLRHRSRLHALGLAREIAALRGDGGALHVPPGAVRTEYTYRIDVTFQVAIEFQLAQPHVQAWLRQRPGMSQTLLDALYFPTREWLKGGDRIAPHAIRSHFHEALVVRMNLGEVQAAGAAVALAGALSDDDKSFLAAMMEEVLRFLCDVRDVLRAAERWNKLPAKAWSPRAEPGLPVLQSMLLGEESLVTRSTTSSGDVYHWRYFPTGEARQRRAEEPAADLADPAVVPPPTAPATAVATDAPVPAPAAGKPRAVLDPDVTARMERILAIEANLWRVFKWAEDPAAPEGRVYKMLGDRLRVLPTTPAWSRVQAAIVNVNQVLTGSGSRSTLLEDGRALTDFLAMLDVSAKAVIHTLMVASFCGAARIDAVPPDALLLGLNALSTGQGFASLDAEGLAWAMERMETSARDYGGAGLADIAERAAAFLLDDPRLLREARKAQALGAAALPSLDWAAAARNAWESLEERLPRFLASDESPAASLHEVLCEIHLTGPAPLVGLDLKAMTLQRWTSAFLTAAGVALPYVRLAAEPPKWLMGPALNRLGAASIDGVRLADLVAWALGPQVVPGSGSAIHDAILTRKRGNEPIELSNRLALCVTSGPEAPMGQWTARPRRGLVLVLVPELLKPVIETIATALKLPLLVATAQGLGVRISPDEVTTTVRMMRPGDRQIWVYRQRFAQMLEPNVIGPQTADEVLDYVQPPSQGASSVA